MSMTHFEHHQQRLQKAIQTCQNRQYWSPFQESPRAKNHPEGAKKKGYQEFQSTLHQRFLLEQPGGIDWIGKEVSPLTNQPLGIKYPKIDVDIAMTAAVQAIHTWKKTSKEERVGMCLHLLEKLAENAFVNTFATMHTAGQPFMTAFAGSGANALDRGLEALAHAHMAMDNIPNNAQFWRSFGTGQPVLIEKTYRLQPRGVAQVICCGTFPTWNAYPAILANLATANAVIVKPHPNGILPMAIAVRTCRIALQNSGYDPNIIQLICDEPQHPITLDLLHHPETAIVDFTGSPTFGCWIEQHVPNALIYTETAGCNSVVIESTNDLDGMLHAIAQSLCLFSAQMCTSPQNIFIPKTGIHVNGEPIPFADVVTKLLDKIDSFVGSPTTAAALCGAIMSPKTIQDIKHLTSLGEEQGTILRRSNSYQHPEFPSAQTATPLLVQVDIKQAQIYRQEFFGPMAFIIASDSAQQALEQATADAKECGAISCYAYSINEPFLENIQDLFAEAGASVGCNLINHLPINFAAAYSDFHVTGLNPAGNACLTDLAFVSNRFRIVQSKIERSAI